MWIFKNTTIYSKNIPIAIFSGLEPEHFFNVTADTSFNLEGTIYDVWKLEDEQGSIAYYEKNTGILINGLFYFSGMNTWEINMTDTNVYIPPNDFAPQLKNPSVNPTFGNLTTKFIFSVNYSDIDNNNPISIGVVINETYHQMLKKNPFETNYTDGIIYEFQTYLLNGTYEYFFNTSDGIHSVSTGVFSGPNVYYNNSFSPILEDASLYPLLGYNSSTNFLYQVKYSDLDNNAPDYVNLIINGISYSMKKQDNTDANFMDGSFFSKQIIFNVTGHYIYNFTASDGKNTVFLPSTGYYHNPNVTLHNMNDIDIGWVVSHGEQSNSTYTTFLDNAISLGATSVEYSGNIIPDLIHPYEILLVEEGGNSWKDYELKNLNYWIENGGSLIVIGDNIGDAQQSISNMYNVTYNLIGGLAGSSTEVIQPHFLTVNVNTLNFGSPQSSLDKQNSNINLKTIVNTSDGYPMIALLEVGIGKILWITDEFIENSQIYEEDNEIFGLNMLRWMGESKTNLHAPTLSNIGVSPSTGNSTTHFTFSATFTDMDNRGPTFINLTLNEETFQMTKKEKNDFNYTDGVIFKYETYLQNGTYQYHINASDGYFYTSSPEFNEPVVSYINIYDPELSYALVVPVSGYEHQLFNFQVNYSDKDNNFPKYVIVTIDNETFSMEKQDPEDVNFIDGVIYEYQTYLNVGSHQFYFNASDNENNVSTTIFDGPEVKQSPLKNQRIGWIITHGEAAYADYSDLVNNAMFLGASVDFITENLNSTLLENFDILVIAEGGTSWNPSELNALKNWIVDGNSLLILGDDYASAQISVSAKFNVFYSTQMGSSGDTTDIFHPHEITSGVSTIYFPSPSSSISQSSTNYLTPLVYDMMGRLIISSLHYGSGRLLWVVDDCFNDIYLDQEDNLVMSNNSIIWLADTEVNLHAPSITKVELTPPTGNYKTIFNFQLNFTDIDGSAPIYVNLTINDVIYQLTKLYPDDFNFKDGVIYNISIQLSAGTYYYHFNVSDGKFICRYPDDQLMLIVSNGDNDFLMIIIIISSSVAGVVGVGSVIYIIKHKKTKTKELIDRVVEDIQDKKG